MIIETKRLVLRPFVESDAKDVFEYLNKPSVNCFNSMKLDTIDMAKKEMLIRSKDTDYYLAIVLKKENKVIGEISAHPEPSDPHSNVNIKDTFSPCFMLNLKYSKKGYAYEAAYAFFDYLFKEKNARRIYAYAEDYNISSQHLCEKLGMRKEGKFMGFISFVNKPDGTPLYENTIQYAILKKEWLK